MQETTALSERPTQTKFTADLKPGKDNKHSRKTLVCAAHGMLESRMAMAMADGAECACVRYVSAFDSDKKSVQIKMCDPES